MASEERERVVADLWALPSSEGLTVEEWRRAAGWRERLPSPEQLRSVEVVAGGVPCEWESWEATPTDGPVICFFHGGGWVLCSIGTHRVLGGRLAGAVGGRTLVVGYRLAPEHPFPAAVHDCAAAYRWLLDQGIDPQGVTFAGDSAGGNLVVATALALRDQGVELPGALVAWLTIGALGIYLILAMKRFYGQNWWRTGLKFAGAMSIYLIFILAPAVMLVMVASISEA